MDGVCEKGHKSFFYIFILYINLVGSFTPRRLVQL